METRASHKEGVQGSLLYLELPLHQPASPGGPPPRDKLGEE